MAAKLSEEKLDCAIQPRFVMTRDRNGKVGIDHQLAAAHLHFGRQGHQVHRLRLYFNRGCEH